MVSSPLQWHQEADLQADLPSNSQADSEKLSSQPQVHNSAAHLMARHTGTDKHNRNRQAQARYRERMRAAAQHVQIRSRQPLEEFVVDPYRHSIEVVRHRMADEMMPWLEANMTIFNHCTQLLGWTGHAILTDTLCTFMVKWSLAVKAALRTLINNYSAQPSKESLSAITPFTCQLRAAYGLYWHSMLEGHAWPQTIVSACNAAIVAKWGEPLNTDHIKQSVAAMQLNIEQKGTVVTAYHRWQQQTSAAQHRSVHILPGMHAMHKRGKASLDFGERQLHDQKLHECEMAQKQAAAELHNTITSTATPYQWVLVVCNCKPYGRDVLKLCEAIEQSMDCDVQQARQEHPDLQNAALGHEQPLAATHAAQQMDLSSGMNRVSCTGSSF
ncbi:hypothetical protein WJX73_008708 [Symbiochloris irregularis]|uniref:Uncharacterized protein n=1 Tax=Symbiochloris irregularis TaxID=706552 RepID=A0AAW1PWN2_9CHLO